MANTVGVSLDDIRVLQKRTRDKEYRLRKQGASQDSIAKVSPRESWGSVKAMTPVQRRRYAKQLDRFNKKSAYVGSASGDVIPKSYITQSRKLIKAHNKFVASETRRIQGIAPDLWEQYRARQIGILAHEASIGGLLTPVDVRKMVAPRSLEVAKRRVKNFEARNKRKFSYYRRIQRENMTAMFNELGLYDLSELVRHMSNDQFDVLSSVLPTWEVLTVHYADVSSGNEEYADVRAYVYKASMLGKKDYKRSLAGLERNRAKRNAKGMARAFSELE